MSSQPWFENEAKAQDKQRDGEAEFIDYQPPATVQRPTENDLGSLAAIARAAGPRDLRAIREQVRQVGAELGAILDPKGEGTAAYYRWHAGGSVIEGPTVGLMDAIAGIWGRLVYSITMIEEKGQRVHLRGRVVDILAIVAHERDYPAFLRSAPAKFAKSPDEAERWRVMQLQSAESKAIRGVLEHVIPAWVVEEALEAARDAAAKARTGGRPVAEGAAKALGAITGLGVPVELVVRWVGRPVAEWTAYDLQALRDLYTRAKRGEVTADGLRVEAAEREAERQVDAPAATGVEGDAGSADRLAGLGLGKGATADGQAPGRTRKPKAETGAPDAAPKASEPEQLTSEQVVLIAAVKDGDAVLGADLAMQARRDCELPRVRPEDLTVEQLRALVARQKALADSGFGS